MTDNPATGAASARRRRQWGSEKPRPPLPAISPPASNAANWMGGFAIAATIALWLT